jgi:DNA-directed RNA polymerase-3 subunit RPC5
MQDDDPVIAEYNVFITPRQLEQIYLLQYPNRNRTQPYNDRNGARPVDFRIKPQAGFMEMDIAMNPTANFNKFQSLLWGEAIRKSKLNGASATFGAAAGFAPTKGGKGRPKQESGAEMTLDHGLARFEEAVNRDAVFAKQTLGGQVLQDEAGNPNYMLGAFRGDELHLTHVDGVVQMRPQFHHVDAITHAETAARRAESSETNANGGPGAGPGGAAAAARQPQALALAQTYKDNRDVENLEALRAKNLLLIAQEEKWTRLEYFDEDVRIFVFLLLPF